MRQALGAKRLRQYSQQHGKVFVAGLVRGNTEHRVDLTAEDGTRWCAWPDGTLERDEWLEEKLADARARGHSV